MKTVRAFTTVCISLYVEELVALDAKVEAMKQSGYTRMSRSRMLVMSALALEDGALAGRRGAPRAKNPPRIKKPEPPTPKPDYRCGKCGVYGHNRRSCQGLERESR